MISLSHPTPIKDAVDSLSTRTPLGTALRSRELSELPREIKTRSFFSATVEEVKLLDSMKRQLLTRLKLERRKIADGEQGTFQRRDQFLREMQRLAEKLGVRPKDERRGTLRDIGSFRRLRLIWDTQMDMARGYAQYKRGLDVNVLQAEPAQELIRREARRIPRDWSRRWEEAGGRLFEGRMIALKTDPVWIAISRFDNPYPPFDFNSGMGVKRVRRNESDRLGITQKDELIKVEDSSFNANLSISLKGFDNLEKPIKSRLGDLVDVHSNKVEWRGDKLDRLYERAELRLQGQKFNKKLRALSFGEADAQLIERAKPFMDLTGFKMNVNEDDIFHILSRHGSTTENQVDQPPVTLETFYDLLVYWRKPKSIQAGKKKRSLQMVYELGPELVTILWNQHPLQNVLNLVTMWRRLAK